MADKSSYVNSEAADSKQLTAAVLALVLPRRKGKSQPKQNAIEIFSGCKLLRWQGKKFNIRGLRGAKRLSGNLEVAPAEFDLDALLAREAAMLDGARSERTRKSETRVSRRFALVTVVPCSSGGDGASVTACTKHHQLRSASRRSQC